MASPSEVEVVAVVLNWRQPAITESVCRDFVAQGEEGWRLVVIDNGSGDGSVDRLRLLVAGLPRSELIEAQENLGYCKGCNLGIGRAKALGARYVLLLNNDMQLPEGSVRPLVDALDNDPQLSAVGPTILDPKGRCWSQGGGIRLRANLVTLHNEGGEPEPVTAGPEPVSFLPGACALYRLDALEAVGGLDESYFMYWEDVELGERIRARGGKVAWLPWTRVTHDTSASSGGGVSALRKYLCALNQMRWLRRHGRVQHWLSTLLLDFLLWPLSLGSGTHAAWAKLRGLIDGLRGIAPGPRSVERWTGASRSR